MEERRKKSDLISAEFGRRMLQGWGLYERIVENCTVDEALSLHYDLLTQNAPLSDKILAWELNARLMDATYVLSKPQRRLFWTDGPFSDVQALSC